MVNQLKPTVSKNCSVSLNPLNIWPCLGNLYTNRQDLQYLLKVTD